MTLDTELAPYRAGASDAVINALPLPVLVVGTDGRITDANVAAEAFFEISTLLLQRNLLSDLVPFGSPLLALVEQVRERGAAVNEYRVDLGTPRSAIAFTGEVDRNSPISARNAQAKNSVGVGIAKQIAVIGAANTMPTAQMRSSVLIARLLSRAS